MSSPENPKKAKATTNFLQEAFLTLALKLSMVTVKTTKYKLHSLNVNATVNAALENSKIASDFFKAELNL
ncbi:hypothetical protein RvY_18041 [Ramazzottius varieornatus]|uniref:Uncharacterized protein n=1 Tax=Ramazzottius varieornatus TaxID=947166 RepID=A0A1D1WAJ0_RAMVA|nr:hypothetical protein RvY_18041 [Ramazzottius varieornatus]